MLKGNGRKLKKRRSTNTKIVSRQKINERKLKVESESESKSSSINS